MEADFDVAVTGLRAMENIALWRLAESGLNVAGIEQRGVGHDRGPVGGENRLFQRMKTVPPDCSPVIDEAVRQRERLPELSGIYMESYVAQYFPEPNRSAPWREGANIW